MQLAINYRKKSDAAAANEAVDKLCCEIGAE